MYPCPARILKALITIYLKSLIALACVIKHTQATKLEMKEMNVVIL